jgi:hypothetical protein
MALAAKLHLWGQTRRRLEEKTKISNSGWTKQNSREERGPANSYYVKKEQPKTLWPAVSFRHTDEPALKSQAAKLRRPNNKLKH